MPTQKELDAPDISLRYVPASPAAHALTNAVMDIIKPHLQQSRAIGEGKLVTFRQNLGIVLAGLLRAGLRAEGVSAREALQALMWQGAPIGCRAFWKIAYGMAAAKLVIHTKGKRTVIKTADMRIVGGLPGRLRVTPALLQLADHHNVTRAGIHTDWSRNTNLKPATVTNANLVSIGPWVRGRPKPPLTAAQAATIDAMRPEVAAMNLAVAALTIDGCEQPVFSRKFNHGPQLGGRLYAIADGFQNMSKSSRAAITINGEATANPDIRATSLSIFLILSGQHIEGDPYALPSLPDAPRTAIKAWFRQSLGAGRPAGRWSREMSKADRCGMKAHVIREAALAVYPALRDMMAIVPPEVFTSLPDDRYRTKAVGRYLEFLESEVIITALRDLRGVGHIALPMHDGVICQARAADMARQAIVRASVKVLGAPLTVT